MEFGLKQMRWCRADTWHNMAQLPFGWGVVAFRTLDIYIYIYFLFHLREPKVLPVTCLERRTYGYTWRVLSDPSA